MKDEKHTIDDLFKDRLYDVESDIQPTSWNDISNKIQTKASYSIKKWFYGIGAASTVVAVIAYFIYANATVSPKISPSVLPIEKPAASADAPENKNNSEENQTAVPQDNVYKEPLQQKFSTLEERKTLTLPDGSEVMLNRNSSISYSTHFMEDRIVYVSGEVYVNVSEKGKGLVLISNLTQIEAVESSFIVKSNKVEAYDEILVSTGKVDCKSLLANENRIVIFAGNNAVINQGGNFKRNAIEDVNYNDWVTQKIIFNNTGLDKVFETLEEYYNVSLKAENSEIMNCHFTGTFERNNIDEILQVLSVSFNLSFNQKSKEYILSGKGCK